MPTCWHPPYHDQVTVETIDLHTRSSDGGPSTGLLIRKMASAVSFYQQAAERERIPGSTFMHDNAALATNIHLFYFWRGHNLARRVCFGRRSLHPTAWEISLCTYLLTLGMGGSICFAPDGHTVCVQPSPRHLPKCAERRQVFNTASMSG